MTHPRSLIRNALRDLVAQALPELAGRIHLHRAVPLGKARLPAILVYAREERIDEWHRDDEGACVRKRLLTLGVEIVAAGDDAHDAVDALAARFEAALEADETLGRRVESARLVATSIEQDGDGELVALAARLTVEVVYWTTWRQSADDGVRPSIVLYSVSPHIGRDYEDRYRPLAD